MGWSARPAAAACGTRRSVSAILLVHVTDRKDWESRLIHDVSLASGFGVRRLGLKVRLHVIGTFVHEHAGEVKSSRFRSLDDVKYLLSVRGEGEVK